MEGSNIQHDDLGQSPTSPSTRTCQILSGGGCHDLIFVTVQDPMNGAQPASDSNLLVGGREDDSNKRLREEGMLLCERFI